MITMTAAIVALNRAASYTRVPFYDNKIVDVYFLAENGFKTKNSQIAICQQCGVQIKFDIIDELPALKLPLTLAVNQHQANCSYNSKNKIPLNQQTLFQLGNDFFNLSLQSLQDHGFFQNIKIDEVTQLIQKEQLTDYFQKLTTFMKQIPKSIILLCIFGWRKLNQDDELTCHFCGSQYRYAQNQFNFPYSAHKSFCLISFKYAWKMILKKTLYNAIPKSNYVLEKSDKQIKVKQLRKKMAQKFYKEKSFLQSMKRQYKETLQSMNIKNKKQIADQMSQLLDFAKQSLESTVKKIKLV